MDGFRNEDEAIGHWLARLRDGTPEEQATARTELGLIMERRGLIDDAIEAYRTNVAAGTRDRRPYQRLAAIYRARGDVAAEASVLDALADVVGESESPTMTSLPTVSRAPAPSGPVDAATEPRPTEAVPAADPLGQQEPAAAVSPVPSSASAAQPVQPPVGGTVASPGRRRASISRATGVLIAVLGLLVLLGAIIFALLWSGGRVGGLNLGAYGFGRPAATSGNAGPAGTGAPSAQAQLAAGPVQTPTPAPPPAACWDPATRFPESQQPAESVRRALLDHLERQDGAVDPDNPGVRSLVDAHVERADELVAGWMGVQLQRAQRRLPLFSLSSYIGSELLVPNEVGQYALRPTISEQGWREMQAWPADSCEGAFMTRPENARWVGLMRASVGDISWAQALPSPVPSPSPATR